MFLGLEIAFYHGLIALLKAWRGGKKNHGLSMDSFMVIFLPFHDPAAVGRVFCDLDWLWVPRFFCSSI